jgi:hypothetical protein
MTFMDGQRPKSNRFTPKVLALVADGRSYRLIARELGLSKTPSSISSNGNRCPSAWTFASYVKQNRFSSAISWGNPMFPIWPACYYSTTYCRDPDLAIPRLVIAMIG